MVRLAVSRSKADFLQSLGLANDRPGDRQVYMAIKVRRAAAAQPALAC